MSASVSIYTDTVPSFEFEQLVLDEAVRMSLPIGQADRAKWCREFAAVLLAEAEAAEKRHEQQLRDLAAAQAEIDRLRAEREGGRA